MMVEERFWAKVDVRGPDECWIWTAGKTKGYGIFSLQKPRKIPAHRFAYELLVGPIPEGLTIDHVCHNQAAAAGLCKGGDDCTHRACVNPAHLIPATRGDNTMNGLAPSAVNAAKTECDRGHPFDKENTFVDSRGYRHCRACGRIRKGLSEVKVHGVPKSHCANDHPLTPENTFSNGRSRGCKICRNEAARRYRARKRAS